MKVSFTSNLLVKFSGLLSFLPLDRLQPNRVNLKKKLEEKVQSANTTLFVPSDQRRPCTLVDHSCEPQTQLIEQQILQNRPTTDRQPNDPLQWQFHSTYDQPLAYFLSEQGIIALKYLMRLCSVHCTAVRFADHLAKVIVNSNSD